MDRLSTDEVTCNHYYPVMMKLEAQGFRQFRIGESVNRTLTNVRGGFLTEFIFLSMGHLNTN